MTAKQVDETTPEEVKKQLAGLKERVQKRKNRLNALGDEILLEVDNLDATLDAAEEGGFCKFIDMEKVSAVLEYLEARAKDYCGEGE